MVAAAIADYACQVEVTIMKNLHRLTAAIAILSFALTSSFVETYPAAVAKSSSTYQVRVSEVYSKLPLYFEANRGQTDPKAKFVARSPRSALFLTSTEAVLVLNASKPAL